MLSVEMGMAMYQDWSQSTAGYSTNVTDVQTTGTVVIWSSTPDSPLRLSYDEADVRRGISGTRQAMRSRPHPDRERVLPERKPVREWARLPRRAPRGI